MRMIRSRCEHQSSEVSMDTKEGFQSELSLPRVPIHTCNPLASLRMGTPRLVLVRANLRAAFPLKKKKSVLKF